MKSWQKRFETATFNTDTPLTIIVGGCGGTGSHVTFLLQCLGHQVTVIDDDLVGIENVGTQLIFQEHIGTPKVQAIEEVVDTLLGESTILGLQRKFGDNFPEITTPIMFSCFDNITARKIFFDAWKSNPNRELLIDIRMNALDYQILCVTKETEELYELNYFPSEDSIEEPICTLKQTRHVAFMATGEAVSYFTNFLTNKLFPDMWDAEVPFFTYYNTTIGYRENIKTNEYSNAV